MEVSLELVKELREKSGAGMADCKKALVESNGDIQKAIEYLRKKGAATAAKRADKIVKEGAVKSFFNDSNSVGSIIEVNCETDFVAKGEDFQKFSDNIAKVVALNGVDSIQQLFTLKINELTVQDELDALMGKLGEKIEIKRVKLMKSGDDGFINGYIHFGSKLGSIIKMKGNKTPEALDLGNKISMQIVAMNPLSLDRKGISNEIIEREKDIYFVQARNDKKPENIIEKIVNNKLEKFFQENCLLEQEFIQESGKSIQKIIEEFNKSNGNNIEIVEFIRYQLGS
jgi:elongation factor Ts